MAFRAAAVRRCFVPFLKQRQSARPGSGHHRRWLRGIVKLCAILGQDAANLANLTLQQLTHPDDLAGEQVLLQQLLRKNEGYSRRNAFTPQAGGVG